MFAFIYRGVSSSVCVFCRMLWHYWQLEQLRDITGIFISWQRKHWNHFLVPHPNSYSTTVGPTVTQQDTNRCLACGYMEYNVFSHIPHVPKIRYTPYFWKAESRKKNFQSWPRELNARRSPSTISQLNSCFRQHSSYTVNPFTASAVLISSFGPIQQ